MPQPAIVLRRARHDSPKHVFQVRPADFNVMRNDWPAALRRGIARFHARYAPENCTIRPVASASDQAVHSMT
jgi:hypothetical protein